MTEARPAGRRSSRVRGRQKAAFVQLPKRQLASPYPPLEIVSGDQIEAIHDASMQVLEEIGMNFLLPEAREILRQAGAEVDGDGPRVAPGAPVEGRGARHVRQRDDRRDRAALRDGRDGARADERRHDDRGAGPQPPLPPPLMTGPPVEDVAARHHQVRARSSRTHAPRYFLLVGRRPAPEPDVARVVAAVARLEHGALATRPAPYVEDVPSGQRGQRARR